MSALEALALKVPSSGPKVDLTVLAPWEVPNWVDRVSYMGVETPPTPAPTTAATNVFQPQVDARGSEVIAPLLRTAPVRAQIIDLVRQATQSANISSKKTEYLLHDLDALLRQN